MSTRPQQPDPVPEGAVPDPAQDLPAPGERERAEPPPEPGADAATGPDGADQDDTSRVLAELEDRWRRALADLDNLRKRHARELERELAAERARTATALLPLIDNLELALAHAEAHPGAIVDGVKAVRDQGVDAFARLGYPRHSETGVPFDPTRHEVVGVVEDPEAEPGTVVEVLRPGYGDADHQLRPVAVVVSQRE
ncbi:nucleotide exchange factor GrpE [Streptomyces sp. NPDC048636]|uniref:nucleotide exchange factor GrpE n=1 Tax=Streptomyces sp. NPDC048636 TaxID=3155762 RepID=UPI003413568F